MSTVVSCLFPCCPLSDCHRFLLFLRCISVHVRRCHATSPPAASPLCGLVTKLSWEVTPWKVMSFSFTTTSAPPPSRDYILWKKCAVLTKKRHTLTHTSWTQWEATGVWAHYTESLPSDGALWVGLIIVSSDSCAPSPPFTSNVLSSSLYQA